MADDDLTSLNFSDYLRGPGSGSSASNNEGQTQNPGGAAGESAAFGDDQGATATSDHHQQATDANPHPLTLPTGSNYVPPAAQQQGQRALPGLRNVNAALQLPHGSLSAPAPPGPAVPYGGSFYPALSGHTPFPISYDPYQTLHQAPAATTAAGTSSSYQQQQHQQQQQVPAPQQLYPSQLPVSWGAAPVLPQMQYPRPQPLLPGGPEPGGNNNAQTSNPQPAAPSAPSNTRGGGNIRGFIPWVPPTRPADEVYNPPAGKIPPPRKQKKQRQGNNPPPPIDPRDYYRRPLVPANWGPIGSDGRPAFRYTANGELEPTLRFGVREIEMLIKARGTRLLIQHPPAQHNDRYPLPGVSNCCRWEGCRVPNHTILKAHWRVALDITGDQDADEYDPFYAVCYFHLDCLERLFPLVELFTHDEIHIEPDQRTMPHEERNPMALSRDNSGMISTLQSWLATQRARYEELGFERYWRQRKRDDMLSYVLTRTHVFYQGNSRHVTRKTRGGVHIGMYWGDLFLYAELEAEQREEKRRARLEARRPEGPDEAMEVDEEGSRAEGEQEEQEGQEEQGSDGRAASAEQDRSSSSSSARGEEGTHEHQPSRAGGGDDDVVMANSPSLPSLRQETPERSPPRRRHAPQLTPRHEAIRKRVREEQNSRYALKRQRLNDDDDNDDEDNDFAAAVQASRATAAPRSLRNLPRVHYGAGPSGTRTAGGTAQQQSTTAAFTGASRTVAGSSSAAQTTEQLEQVVERVVSRALAATSTATTTTTTTTGPTTRSSARAGDATQRAHHLLDIQGAAQQARLQHVVSTLPTAGTHAMIKIAQKQAKANKKKSASF